MPAPPLRSAPQLVHLDADCPKRTPGEPVAVTYDVAVRSELDGLGRCADCAFHV